MFNIPAITWTFTAVLLLVGSYHLLQAVRSHRLADRVNKCLHALMHVLMAAMLWNLASSTRPLQIVILAVAAMWFVIQAVARPEFKTFCVDGRGRLKCLYHGLTMAGAALMIAMMSLMTNAGHGTGLSGGMPGMSMAHDHHSMAAPPHITAAMPSGSSPFLAVLLTTFFGASAVIFMVLLLRYRLTKTTHRKATAPQHSSRPEHGLEALGAAAMALMFATMTA